MRVRLIQVPRRFIFTITPRTTLRLLGEAVDEAWREQVEGTHPGGSLIGVNGRNAAMAILNG